MLRKMDWTERTAQLLATGTFLFAGYGVGHITATIVKLLVA